MTKNKEKQRPHSGLFKFCYSQNVISADRNVLFLSLIQTFGGDLDVLLTRDSVRAGPLKIHYYRTCFVFVYLRFCGNSTAAAQHTLRPTLVQHRYRNAALRYRPQQPADRQPVLALSLTWSVGSVWLSVSSEEKYYFLLFYSHQCVFVHRL